MSGWHQHLSLRALTQIHFLGIWNLLPQSPITFSHHSLTLFHKNLLFDRIRSNANSQTWGKADVFLMKITNVYIPAMISFVLSWGRKKRISSWVLISCLFPTLFSLGKKGKLDCTTSSRQQIWSDELLQEVSLLLSSLTRTISINHLHRHHWLPQKPIPRKASSG